MKIAVATSDGTRLSPHFGRSAAFVVFEISGNTINNREYRANNHTPHAQGKCAGDHEHGTHSHASHNHDSIIGLLADCEAVLCGGMGPGAVDALKERGIRPVILHNVGAVDEAVRDFLNGSVPDVVPNCGCH